jgi:hypothetical protein
MNERFETLASGYGLVEGPTSDVAGAPVHPARV